MSTPITVLIDGDIIAYRCGFACEHKQYQLTFKDGTTRTFEGKIALNKYIKEEQPEDYEWESTLFVEPLNFALSTTKHMVANIISACGAHRGIVFLSGRNNFRNAIATIQKYKGNRDKARRPIHHADIIEYLYKHKGAISADGLEADDLLAQQQTSDTIIASIDKDLLQIPGKHFNFVKGDRVLVTPATATRNLFKQLLMGDSTDNIPGIRGIGPAGAEKLLGDASTNPEYWEICMQAWHDYLSGPTCPDWVIRYDKDNTHKTVTYLHHSGTPEISKPLFNVLLELWDLLQVGRPGYPKEEIACGPSQENQGT